ncbi:MAG: FecR domain-containing protein [bacterium]|nr:FecR domain-containing protein [bacterium]
MIKSVYITRNFLSAFICLTIFVFLCPVSALAIQEIASFTNVKGEVRINSSVRAKGKWMRVKKAGVTLYSGDEIRTIAGSAEITFDDGSVMKVNEDTSFKLEERPTKRKLFGFVDSSFMNRNIKVSFGKLWANIKKARGKWTSFESKVAVAGIKGTSVSMYLDSNGDLQFACHDGLAALAKPDGSYEFSLGKGKEVWIKSKDQDKTLIQSVKGELDIESKNGTIDLEDKGSVLIGETAEGTSVGVPGSVGKTVNVSNDSLNATLDAGDEIIIGIARLEGGAAVTTVRNASGSVEIGVGDIKAMLDGGDVFTVTVNRALGTVTLAVVNGTVEVVRNGQTTEMKEGDIVTDDLDIINPDTGVERDKGPEEQPFETIVAPLPVEEDCGSSPYIPGSC